MARIENDFREAIMNRLRREMDRRLKACAILVANHAKLLINIDGTGRAASGYTSKYHGHTRRVRKGAIIYGANPSRPGQPPHKQTGHLQSSIAWEIEGLVARVGTSVLYGRHLELGTSKMAARPWLRRALREKEAEIIAIISAPIKRG